MKTIVCAYCGKEAEAKRRDKKFCSVACALRLARNFPKTRNCRHCGKPFEIITRSDANRQHCSQKCAKSHNTKTVKTWFDNHPEAMREYNKNRVAKNPGAWREKQHAERLESIRILGGRCIVCGVTNPNWLHVDYIPTTRNKPYRHPRHLYYIRQHIGEFRLLCANHHYELTLTGQIEGTEIVQ